MCVLLLLLSTEYRWWDKGQKSRQLLGKGLDVCPSKYFMRNNQNLSGLSQQKFITQNSAGWKRQLYFRLWVMFMPALILYFCSTTQTTVGLRFSHDKGQRSRWQNSWLKHICHSWLEKKHLVCLFTECWLKQIQCQGMEMYILSSVKPWQN